MRTKIYNKGGQVMEWLNYAGLYASIIFNIIFKITEFIACVLFIKVCITYLNKNK